MLSRVADSLFWVGRYIERAENTARALDVNLQLTLDGAHGKPQDHPSLWQPLVQVAGDEDVFKAPVADRNAVLKFYCGERINPNSIVGCIASARENARSVRDTISSNMWRHLNEVYLWTKQFADQMPSEDFFERIKRECALFQGLADSTMTHGEGWHFMNLGRMLERADKTSRILEVKAVALLGTDLRQAGSTSEMNQWSAVLRSVSAFEMYRKRYSRTQGDRVISFLALDRTFPRSCLFCISQAHLSLKSIIDGREGHEKMKSERALGRLRADLEYAELHEVLVDGLAPWCDTVQARIDTVAAHVHGEFFAPTLDDA